MTKKQLVENKIRRLVKKALKENQSFDDEFISQVSEKCNWNVDNIFSLFAEVLRDSNHNTVAKYIDRLGSDISRSGSIEKTDFYKAGIY
jgi:energy-converting hydrogenase A subunit M